MPIVTRRLLVQQLHGGEVTLDAEQSHHARSVLRMEAGEAVELFDAAGRTASGVVIATQPLLIVQVQRVNEPDARRSFTVASAVPKGDRADVLVEKLSELGTSQWIPLRTERSVVHPEGASKFERWHRLAQESAKQCRRDGVMRIGPLTPIDKLAIGGDAIVLSTQASAPSMLELSLPESPLLLVGPEGGWSPAELEKLRQAGAMEARLTSTILRIETACLAAAVVVACRLAARS
jgi:16S rRNA (uracil1498-N3)-methyltransferase